MTNATLRAGSLTDLKLRIDGDLITPGDPEWDEARRAWNLAVDQRPAAVVMAESAHDVVATVQAARAQGLLVAPQGTGHFAPALGSLERTILLKTSRMRGIEIDAEARRARVEAGVLWIEVVEAAAEHGLAGLAGSSPDVGVVGYSLGGGIGWLGRKYGLATNSVVAVELVTADGEHVRADRNTNPDLFWAVRGGGGGFGIVTAIEFTLYPVEEVYAGILFFPIERAVEVLNAWREWIRDTPNEVTSCGRLLQIPPIPEVPEFLQGRSFVAVQAAVLGSEAEGDELIRPLRELGPEVDTFAMIPAKELSHLHMDPPHPVPDIGDGGMLGYLTDAAVEEVVAAFVDTPLISLEFRQLGGAFAESSPDHGVTDRLDADFAYFAVGIPVDEGIARALEAAVAAVRTALSPCEARRTYFNFTVRTIDTAELFEPETVRRLQAVKAEVDPDELFNVAHPVVPARYVLKAAAR
jgi:FAD/FMN-containing dehydrogenase